MPVAAAIDRIVAAGSPLADALQQALAGDDAALDGYGAARRPIAQQVVPVAPARASLRIAWRLSGLVYR